MTTRDCLRIELGAAPVGQFGNSPSLKIQEKLVASDR